MYSLIQQIIIKDLPKILQNYGIGDRMNTLPELMKITKKMSLLYAEDEEIIGQTTNIIFKSMFKKALLVENGQIALNEFIKGAYDIVVTDIHMPILDGFELSMKLKDTSTDLPILITSALVSKKMGDKFKERGIYYLKKPFNLDDLMKALSEILIKSES